MVRHSDKMMSEVRENMRGGEGSVTLTPLFETGDYETGTRLISRISLPAGASIGYHIHEGEEEFFYFLSGSAEFNDNGSIYPVKAGDATVTTSGNGHSLKNTGDVPLEFLAVIVLI